MVRGDDSPGFPPHAGVPPLTTGAAPSIWHGSAFGRLQGRSRGNARNETLTSPKITSRSEWNATRTAENPRILENRSTLDFRMMGKAWKGRDWGKFIENTWTWRLSAIEPFFFVGVGLIHGGYRLCEGWLRAPTRDTFAYAKRLREELFI